jgi:hypothetical protein
VASPHAPRGKAVNEIGNWPRGQRSIADRNSVASFRIDETSHTDLLFLADGAEKNGLAVSKNSLNCQALARTRHGEGKRRLLVT